MGEGTKARTALSSTQPMDAATDRSVPTPSPRPMSQSTARRSRALHSACDVWRFITDAHLIAPSLTQRTGPTERKLSPQVTSGESRHSEAAVSCASLSESLTHSDRKDHRSAHPRPFSKPAPMIHCDRPSVAVTPALAHSLSRVQPPVRPRVIENAPLAQTQPQPPCLRPQQEKEEKEESPTPASSTAGGEGESAEGRSDGDDSALRISLRHKGAKVRFRDEARSGRKMPHAVQASVRHRNQRRRNDNRLPRHQLSGGCTIPCSPSQRGAPTPSHSASAVAAASGGPSPPFHSNSSAVEQQPSPPDASTHRRQDALSARRENSGSAASSPKGIASDDRPLLSPVAALEQGLKKAIDCLKTECGFEDPQEIAELESVLDVLGEAHWGSYYSLAHPLRCVREDEEAHPPLPHIGGRGRTWAGPSTASARITPAAHCPRRNGVVAARARCDVAQTARAGHHRSPAAWSVTDEAVPHSRKPPVPRPLQTPPTLPQPVAALVGSGEEPRQAGGDPTPASPLRRSTRRSSYLRFSKNFQASPLTELTGRECDGNVADGLPGIRRSVDSLRLLGVL